MPEKPYCDSHHKIQSCPNWTKNPIKEYQGSLKFNVVTLPINEAEKVTIRNKIKVKILFLNMLIIYISKNE